MDISDRKEFISYAREVDYIDDLMNTMAELLFIQFAKQSIRLCV